MWKVVKGLLSDSAVYGLSRIVGQIAAFLLLPLYTRHLVPADYGTLAMLNIAVMVFGALANLGLNSAVFRRINVCPDESQRPHVFHTCLLSVAASTAVSYVVAWLFAAPIADLLIGSSEQASYLLRLSLLGSSFAMLSGVPAAVLRAKRRVRFLCIVNLSGLLLTIGLTVWLVVGLRWGVEGYVYATLFSDVFTAACMGAASWPSFRGQFSRADWSSMLRYGLPLLPHRLLSCGILLFGQYSVRELLGLTEAGLYDMAARFALPLAVVINAIQEAWVPYKFQIHAEQKNAGDVFRSIFTYYTAGVAYLWVGVSLWGPEALRLMTAVEFHGAALLIAYVALVRTLMGVYYMLGSGIELSDDTRPYSLVSLFGLAAVVVGSYFLVPRLGAAGAALASCAAWLVMGVAAYRLARTRFAIAYEWPTIAQLAAAAVACVGISLWMQQLPVWPRVIGASLLTLAFPAAALLVLRRSTDEGVRLSRAWSYFRPRAAGIPQSSKT